MTTTGEEKPFKVILIGGANVGKTSIFLRLNGEEFKETVPTFSQDYMYKDFNIGTLGKSVRVS